MKSALKKVIPFLTPLVLGLFGGLLIECVVGISSMLMSPFWELDDAPFFAFLCITSVISAIFVVVMAIANTMYLMDLNREYQIRIAVIAETIISVFLLFFSWKLWNHVVGELYHLF